MAHLSRLHRLALPHFPFDLTDTPHHSQNLTLSTPPRLLQAFDPRAPSLSRCQWEAPVRCIGRRLHDSPEHDVAWVMHAYFIFKILTRNNSHDAMHFYSVKQDPFHRHFKYWVTELSGFRSGWYRHEYRREEKKDEFHFWFNRHQRSPTNKIVATYVQVQKSKFCCYTRNQEHEKKDFVLGWYELRKCMKSGEFVHVQKNSTTDTLKKVCISGCDIFQMSIVYAVHFCGLVQAINTKNALNSKTSILYWPCLFVNWHFRPQSRNVQDFPSNDPQCLWRWTRKLHLHISLISQRSHKTWYQIQSQAFSLGHM